MTVGAAGGLRAGTGAPAAAVGVATAAPQATAAARTVLDRGGNAVDAAVAAAWALGVCEPGGSGLGGQASLVARTAAGSVVVVDGHSRAPAAVDRATLPRADTRTGHRATTVPTLPAVLETARTALGRCALPTVLAPAIALAQDGFVVSTLARRQIRWVRGMLQGVAAETFLPDGQAPRVGTVLRQPRLAGCLVRLAEAGVEDFYRGAIARAIVDDMAAHGGLVDADDLAVTVAPVATPYRGRFRGYDAYTTPAPGGGPALLHALAALEGRRPGGAGADAGWYLDVADATSGALRAREDGLLGDVGGGVQDDGADDGADDETDGETTHLCVIDREGTVVSLTSSIQSVFGAKVANARYGFLYNNYLSTCPRRAHPHRLGPGCRPRSNVAPTILVTPEGGAPDDRPSLVAVGAAGSRRILSSTAGVLDRVLGHGTPLAAAIAAPRIHGLLDRRVWVERSALGEELGRLLDDREVEVKASLAYDMGCVQAVARHGRVTLAAADPRRDGTATGYGS